jgi:CheY-like chemotaxis protein
MRLDFHILWIEDNPDNAQSYKDGLDIRVKREGFKIDAVFVTSVAEAQAQLANDDYSGHIDLILIDYQLGDDGPNGDAGILYSGGKNLTQLREIVAKYDGIYCAVRGDDLVDTAAHVFENLIKKVVDIDHSRGIVMGATSDIDYVIHDSLLAVYEALSPEGQTEFLSRLGTRVDKKLAKLSKEGEELKKLTDLAKILEDYTHLLSADERLKVFREIIANDDRCKPHSEKVTGYATSIIPDRNVLAHVRVKKDGLARKLINRKGEEFTAEKMKTLRIALLDHRGNFHEVGKLLGVDLDD